MKHYKKYLFTLCIIIICFLVKVHTAEATLKSAPNAVVNVDTTKVGTFTFDNGYYGTTFPSSTGGFVTTYFQKSSAGDQLVGFTSTDSSGNKTSYYEDPPVNKDGIADKAAINSFPGSSYDTYLQNDKPVTGAVEGTSQSQANLDAQATRSQECFALSLFGSQLVTFNPQVCAAMASNLALQISSWFLWLAATVFNFTIKFSLDLGAFLTQMPIVGIGWKILRDLANMFFIFILIAIAIGTILQIDSYDVKKLLARVIIVALLLNFSLFFAKVVIDASNILTLQFYNRIASTGSTTGVNATDSGISDAFIQGLGLSSVYSAGSGASGSLNTGSNPITGASAVGNILLIGIGGSILIIVASFVFWVATILFIIRTIVLIFVMILSPLAFLAYVLPNTKGWGGKWTDALIKQSFFAPIFMLLMYIVVVVINGKYTAFGGGQMNFADLLTGHSDAAGTIYTFIILIALMLGSVMVAKQFGAYGSDVATKWGGKLSFGVAGRLSRATVGYTANRLSKSEAVSKLATGRISGALGGRALARGLDKTASGSLDIRGIPGLDKYAGKPTGKGGYVKEKEDREKEDEKRLKNIKEVLETTSPQDNAKLLIAAEEREAAEALQSAELVKERMTLSDELDKVNEDKKIKEEALALSKKEATEANNLKTAEISSFRTMTDAAEENRRRLQSIIDNPDNSNSEAERVAKEELAKIDPNEYTTKLNEHNTRMQELEAASNEKNNKANEIQGHVDNFNKNIKTLGNDIKEKDEKIKSMNKDYKPGGNSNENSKSNFEVLSKVASRANRAQEYAKKNDLENKNSSQMDQHVKAVQTNHIIIKGDIARQKEEKVDNFIKPSLSSRVAAKMGITSAQVNFANKVRKDRGKSDAEKFYEVAKKAAQKELDEDKKETPKTEAASASQSPTSPTPPPTI